MRRWWNRNERDIKGCWPVAVLAAIPFLITAPDTLAKLIRKVGGHQTCQFDRNELGPMGTYGQWWWDIYKCPDGTERRVLVAGPRG